MDGIHESVARRYSPAQLAKLFGPGGEHIRVIYERPNGDRTSPISSSLHSTYAGKGWKAVEVYRIRKWNALLQSKCRPQSPSTPVTIAWRSGNAATTSWKCRAGKRSAC